MNKCQKCSCDKVAHQIFFKCNTLWSCNIGCQKSRQGFSSFVTAFWSIFTQHFCTFNEPKIGIELNGWVVIGVVVSPFDYALENPGLCSHRRMYFFIHCFTFSFIALFFHSLLYFFINCFNRIVINLDGTIKENVS